MKNTWLMAVVVSLLASAAACHRTNKGEQLAALESAYQSGVLSKKEYEAKKSALLGPSAPPPGPAAAPVTPPAAPPSHASPQPAVPESAAPVTLEPAPPPPSKRTPAPPPARPVAATRVTPPAVPPPPAFPQPAVPESAASATPEPAPPPARPAAAARVQPAPSGCEDAEYKPGKEKGVQEHFFPAPLETVKKAAAGAFTNLEFIIHKDANNEMEASKKRHLGILGGGERVTLIFERAQRGGQTGTRVSGETRKNKVARIAQKSWTNAVFAQIACKLGGR